jgi:hypothetical protein
MLVICNTFSCKVQSFVRELYGSLWREGLIGAVEESPLLETVSRERLVKTQQTEDLVCAVVICNVWKLVIVL